MKIGVSSARIRLCSMEPSEPALAQSIGTEKETIFRSMRWMIFFGGGQGERKAAARHHQRRAYPEGACASCPQGRDQRVPSFGAL